MLVLIVGPKLFIEPGDESLFPAFERERPRIVNNFAARLSNLAVVLGSGNEYSDEDESFS